MNGIRQPNPCNAQRHAENVKTPIRTFAPEYERNPDHRWVVARINEIVSNPEKRAATLESIRNALFSYAAIKIDCGQDTIGQLAALLDPENKNPELRKVWEIRAAAAFMLGGTRSKEAVLPLIAAFEKEPNFQVKQAICLALGVIGLEGAPLRRFSEALILWLENSKWEGPERKNEYMEFIRAAFYKSEYQPNVVFGEGHEELLTQSLAGRRPGSEGALNWHTRASAALLLGASTSINTLPNLISAAAKKGEAQQVRDAAREAAARMGRKDIFPTEVRGILNQFIAPGRGERPNPDMEREAIEILRLMYEEEDSFTPMPHMLSSAELELQTPQQKFIGMLRMARETGEYHSLAKEFPVETIISNMASLEYVKISPAAIPELKRMFMELMKAAIRVKGPEVYKRSINALVDAAVAELLEKKKELGEKAQAECGQPPRPSAAGPALSPEDSRFIESLRQAYKKGDYSGFVRGVEIGEAIRKIVLSSSAMLEDKNLPFLKQLISDVIFAAVRARGQKAFLEAAEALYGMALENEPYVHMFAQAILGIISTSKRVPRKQYNP